MASIGGVDLGDIQSENQTKDSNLFQSPIPTLDSDEALLLDLFGMSRTINIEGIYQGTIAQQATFISNIDNIASGSQSGSTFVSSQTSTPNKTVYIQSWSWTVNAADTSKLNYSMILVEGATS